MLYLEKNAVHKNQSVCLILSGILLIHLSSGSCATLTLNQEEKFQIIEGFGGGFSFRTYPYFHPKKEELYDSIFNAARINVVRIGNYYYQETTENRQVETPMMLEIQHRWPEVKTILTSWSPPPFLKSNDSFIGGNEFNDTGTIKRNSDGLYMYEEYAYYWMKAVEYFTGHGMKIDWLSIQNEPDCPAWYEGCVLDPFETPSAASYGKALNAVYNTFRQYLASPPPLIGPDVVGIYDNQYTRYLESPDINRDQLIAYCHHLYNYSGPDWMALPPQQFPGKPIYQTEFLINEGEVGRTWLDHAVFIHNSLAVEGVSMYCIFALAYKPASTHCFFSMDTSGGDWYKARPTYYMFKHFSRSIRRGWRRCAVTVDDPTLLVSAYSNTNNDSTAIVIINTDVSRNAVDLSFPGNRGEYYQTSAEDKYVHKGNVSDNAMIECAARSITTIELHTDNNAVKYQPKRMPRSSTRIEAVQANVAEGVNVHYNAPSGGAITLSLLDYRGSVLVEHVFPNRNRLDGVHHFNRSLPAGSYMMTLRSGTGVAVKKFVVVE